MIDLGPRKLFVYRLDGLFELVGPLPGILQLLCEFIILRGGNLTVRQLLPHAFGITLQAPQGGAHAVQFPLQGVVGILVCGPPLQGLVGVLSGLAQSVQFLGGGLHGLGKQPLLLGQQLRVSGVQF